MVSSLINKTSGKIKLFGHDLDNDIIAAKTCMGLVPQELNFNQFEKVVITSYSIHYTKLYDG